MKSTLFASTLAAALTGTSFGQVDVQLIDSCCGGNWNHTYVNEILIFDTSDDYGFTVWDIQVPEDTIVSYVLSWNPECCPPEIFDLFSGPNAGPFASMINSWNAQGSPPAWNGSLILPAGSYLVQFGEFEGSIDFDFEFETQGSCCVNTGCASIAEADCSEMGGTWPEGGSCEDCEPVADDCPADVDGDGTIGFSDVLIILNDWGACP